MSVGDTNYVLVAAGSTTASVATLQPLFGTYQGLSALNENEVVNIQITGGGSNEFFIGLAAANVSNNIGYKIYPGLSTVDLPPMRVGQASQLNLSRAVSGLDPISNFVIWARRP